jgi:hypothetical protein
MLLSMSVLEGFIQMQYSVSLLVNRELKPMKCFHRKWCLWCLWGPKNDVYYIHHICDSSDFLDNYDVHDGCEGHSHFCVVHDVLGATGPGALIWNQAKKFPYLEYRVKKKNDSSVIVLKQCKRCCGSMNFYLIFI